MSHSPVIAVIDDDQAIREALEDLLSSLGYSALPFASAEEFLAFPGRSAVACMVVDVRMGGMTGLDLQALLNAQGGSSPMIFMTSYTDAATRSKALAGGAHGFLEKPVDAEVLIGCLASALRREARPS
ncbi:response regulator transcription factor [Inquilinus sp. CA228]|uniref:response regulator transcription factor n=1 Tax=Inquilinus sp. CA228 TaxID=3455609 RepID=UPI003F8CFE07